MRVRLVVVGRAEAAGAGGGDHRLLAGIALAGRMPLDRADRGALVRNAAELGPRGQGGHQPAVDVRGVGAGVPADLLVPDRGDRPASWSSSVSQLVKRR